MIVLSRSVSIADNEVELSAIRAQGAGGQHVIRRRPLSICVFDVHASSLPPFYKQRLLEANHHLISADGVVIIKAQEYRSQR